MQNSVHELSDDEHELDKEELKEEGKTGDNIDQVSHEGIPMPKRPKEPFHIFLVMNEKLIKEKFASNESVNCTKLIWEKWQSLDEEGKSHFNQLSETDKERYRLEMEEYNKAISKSSTTKN